MLPVVCACLVVGVGVGITAFFISIELLDGRTTVSW